MKKLFLILVLFSFQMFSQDIKDKIAQETCECSLKIDFNREDKSNLDLEFGVCMLESYNKYIDEFSENDKLDFGNSVQMEKFGEGITLKMVKFCPETILKLGENYIDEEDNDNQNFILEGTFNVTKNESFFTVSIKEANGKVTKLVLLEEFQNAYLITDKVLKNNDKVTVNYYSVELFDIKLNRFVSTNILTDITQN